VGEFEDSYRKADSIVRTLDMQLTAEAMYVIEGCKLAICYNSIAITSTRFNLDLLCHMRIV